MALPFKKNSRSRDPTTNESPTQKNQFKMVTTWGEYYYSWNGKLYESDIIRACIRPKAKAIGKLTAKHIRRDKEGLIVNPKPYIRMLLEYPNPYMTAQQFQEKMAMQLCLNNNAFALIIRDENGLPMQLYPIPAVMVEAKYDKEGTLFLQFTYKNGNQGTFAYSDIIHLRQDFCESDLFGESPIKALQPLMECVGYIDQGIIKAIRNSGMIRWLLKFSQSLRPEDIKKNTQEFVDNYLSVESETFGAAGVDQKTEAKQIEPKDYVPNASQSDRITDRVYSFFNTNKKIVQSSWNEDEWNAYFEAEIEPVAIQFGQIMTSRLFSRNEYYFGNAIVYEASNLQCASLNTKLNFQAMVDRGAMTPNEWRETMNMAPIEGGDQPIRRLDTQVVNMIETALDKMDKENCSVIADMIGELIHAAVPKRIEGGDNNAEKIQGRYPGTNDTE